MNTNPLNKYNELPADALTDEQWAIYRSAFENTFADLRLERERLAQIRLFIAKCKTEHDARMSIVSLWCEANNVPGSPAEIVEQIWRERRAQAFAAAAAEAAAEAEAAAGSRYSRYAPIMVVDYDTKGRALVKKQCAYCKKSFLATKITTLCSDECKKANRLRTNNKYKAKFRGTKTCLWCKKEFTPTRQYKKLCGEECKRLRRAMYKATVYGGEFNLDLFVAGKSQCYANINCACCGKEFERNVPNQKTCSQECAKKRTAELTKKKNRPQN